MRRSLVIGLLALLALVLPPRSARANMAQPSDSGQISGVLEPKTNTAIGIDRETLSFAVADDLESANVSASYRMTNGTAAAQSLEVAFAFVQSEREKVLEPTITVDGEAVPHRRADVADGVSAGWSKLPGKVGLWRFDLRFAPGQSRVVTVQYTQVAAWDRRAKIATTHTFDYLLSPAKRWASFGGVDLTITLPRHARRWTSTAGLKETDAGYAASLSSLPDGELSFTVMSGQGLWLGMTEVGSYWTTYLVVYALAALGIGVGTGRRWPGRGALFRFFAAGALGCVGATLATFAALAALPGNGFGYGFILCLLLCALAGPIAGIASIARARAVSARPE
jgi:hypothetical protein